MAENNQNQVQTTDVATLYNNQLGTMRYGYFREVGFISVSPIFEAYIGRDPEPGAKMYNHEQRVFFSVNHSDVVRIKEGLKKLATGEIGSFTIPHVGTKGSKYLTIGYILEGVEGLTFNLIEIDENNEVAKDVYFAFNAGETNDNAIILDMDENFEGERAYLPTEELAFRSFLGSLESFLNKEGQHGQAAPARSNTGGGSNRPASNNASAPGQKRRRPISPSSGGGASRPSKPASQVDSKNAGSLFDDENE
jgi:hypothetical protein